jgi:hypothetical protein
MQREIPNHIKGNKINESHHNYSLKVIKTIGELFLSFNHKFRKRSKKMKRFKSKKKRGYSRKS